MGAGLSGQRRGGPPQWALGAGGACGTRGAGDVIPARDGRMGGVSAPGGVLGRIADLTRGRARGPGREVRRVSVYGQSGLIFTIRVT